MILSAHERILLYANTLLREIASGRLAAEDVLIGNFDTITVIAADPKLAAEAVDSILDPVSSPQMRFVRLVRDLSTSNADQSGAMARFVEAKGDLSESDELLAVLFKGAWGILRWRGLVADPVCEFFPAGGDDQAAARLMELAIPHFGRVEGMIKGQWIECEPTDTVGTILAVENDRQKDKEPIKADFPLAITKVLVAASLRTHEWATGGYPLQGIPQGIDFSDGEFDGVRIVSDGAVITVELLAGAQGARLRSFGGITSPKARGCRCHGSPSLTYPKSV